MARMRFCSAPVSKSVFEIRNSKFEFSPFPFPMATLKLEIVTPEARIFSEDVEIVFVPGVEGNWASCQSTSR